MDFPWHGFGNSNRDEGNYDHERQQEWETNPEIEKRNHPRASPVLFVMPRADEATIDGRSELGQPSGQHWLESWSAALLNH